MSWAACPKVRGGLTEAPLFAAVSSALKLSRSEALVSGSANADSDILDTKRYVLCPGQPYSAPTAQAEL